MKAPVMHRLDFLFRESRYGWPVCGSKRPYHETRMTTDDEEVTCLKCMDQITRP